MAGTTFKILKKVHDQATVAAGSTLMDSGRACPRSGVLTISICVDTATPVQLGVSDTSDDTAGTVVELIDLNGGASLSAGVGYVFTWAAISGQTYTLVNKSTGSTTRVRSGSLQLEAPV